MKLSLSMFIVYTIVSCLRDKTLSFILENLFYNVQCGKYNFLSLVSLAGYRVVYFILRDRNESFVEAFFLYVHVMREIIVDMILVVNFMLQY